MVRPSSPLKFQVVEVGAVLERPAEYHEHEDDVFVVLKGEMQFTLGGEATEPVTTKDNLTWVSSAEAGCQFIGIYTERNKLWRDTPQPFPIVHSLSELSSFV